MTDLASSHKLYSEEFHMRHQDAQDERALLQDRISTLMRDMRYHRHMAMIADLEAMYARQAWSQTMDGNRTLQAEIRFLQAKSKALQTRKMPPKKAPMSEAVIDRLIAQRMADVVTPPKYQSIMATEGA
ncbi:hypothetical protein Tco_0468034 [Tanacetum coccineum]